ncbi:MAG TPA: type I secretion system permease/ATPase [Vitreimonas sp.]|uniref:type I secretion system permease/ATPase n=1 Tax=Vitreimonas sp. TaxID=3069702 RepID=UPI002D727CB1|nr:type I secretion system permease/ATPase [Vitreimonas sp.]HYD87554.1 type I secretion system permease/ATPase [Vitreimonas sp.]
MSSKSGAVQAGSAILRDALRACRTHIGYVLLFSAALNLLYLAPSLYMLQVYDRVLTSGGLLTLLYLSAVLLASLAALSFLDATRVRLLTAMAKRLDRIVAPHVLMAALQRDGRQAAGNAQPLREFDTLRAAMTGPPALAAVDAPWTPIYIAVCFLIHPWIGSLALFGGVLLVLIAYINQVAMHRALRENEQTTGAMYNLHASDSAQGDTARALGMEEALVRRQLATRAEMSGASHTAGRSGAVFSASTKFVRLFLQSAALGLGAYLALQQEISAGGIIAASILASRAFAPLELIVGAWRQFEQGRQAYGVLTKVLQTQEQKREFTELPSPTANISVENVGVRAPGGERVLLMGASFRMQPGMIVGVIGPSGAGKTTLVRTVAGALQPDQGAVRIDGAKLTDWRPETIGRHIGYLPQDVGLFAGTIAQNISRFEAGDPGDIDGAVVAAAQGAGVHDLILTLPKGYDTEIGPNGRGLSAGQAQRVGLARALYRDPVLLVLDEPNAHLDQEGEAALIEALKAARERGAAALVVAHRSSMMNAADALMVVRDGRIEMYGPREQVMAKLAGPAQQRPVVVASDGEATGRRS